MSLSPPTQLPGSPLATFQAVDDRDDSQLLEASWRPLCTREPWPQATGPLPWTPTVPHTPPILPLLPFPDWLVISRCPRCPSHADPPSPTA
jgi:hypothetical protein